MTWQKILAQGFATADALLQYLELPPKMGSLAAQKQFKTRVPRGFAARMQKGNPIDPLLIQVLASEEELQPVDGFNADPLQEAQSNPLQGLIHKYQGRVLLTLTGACAINCRYCFRRHFPYQQNNPGQQGWRRVFDYIRQDKTISEVILSGGDPLLASETVIANLMMELADIPHLRSLRFHSRIPIVLPERIDKILLTQLEQTRLRTVMVVHCNHPHEINDSVQDACFALNAVGCQLLNQSVLLKGVNADAYVLAALSERLFDCKILPYYLHLLDKVAGAAHFDLPLEQALRIYHQLQMLLPGYLLPRLAREEPEKGHKTLIV